MKLFFYYAFHSAKNALKKLLKTWVLVFIVIMIAGGVLIGLVLGTALEKAGIDDPPKQEQAAPPPEEEVPIMDIVELASGGVILLMFVLNVLGADKSGAEIFQPADVNLLFPSPMKPQSVLLFRTVTQMGVSVLASVYIIAFQIPNLARSGAGFPMIGGLLGGWILTVCVSQLFKMLCYVTASNHPGFKRSLRRIVYAVLLAIVAGYILFQRTSGLGWWDAALGFFNAPATRFIPFWGWIKGFVMYAAEENVPHLLLCLGLVILCSAALAYLLGRMRCDFYEEALKRTDEKVAFLEAANAERGVGFAKRKKDRASRYSETSFDRGSGSNVFFYKALYNRFRFAHLHVFTKTMEFYLAAALATALICRFVASTASVLPIVLVLAFCAFYRSMGNALKEDTGMWFFHMIPEEGFVKLFWSLAGDLANCFLDVLPALLIGLIVQGAPVLQGLVWLPVILSVTAYATTVGTFIDLSAGVNAGKLIKQMGQALFIYFGLIPDALLVILLVTAGLPVVAALAVTALNLLLTGLFLYLASLTVGTK